MQARNGRDDDTNPTKRYLMEYNVLKVRHAALQTELEYLRSNATRATSMLNPLGVTGPYNPAARENSMLRVVDADARLTELIEHIAEALTARLALIERVPDERQRTLLTLRYINGQAWEQVGYAMHYERTQIYELHTQALRAAAEAWPTFAGGSCPTVQEVG